jgi:hypothetical protein
MALTDIFTAIRDNPLGDAMRESAWMFPTIESIHVVALVLVAGTVSIVDLRLLGVSSRNHAITKLSTELLPWTWSAFVVAAITGGLLFTSNAVKYAENIPFRVKMVLLACAGINMLIFHFITWKSVANWDNATATPGAAKLAGALSLVFWIGVIAAGRWIGFTV